MPTDESLKSWAKADLPRERLLRYGAENLSDRELLAILLATGTKEKNVLELADMILIRAQGLRGLGRMSLQELEIYDGIGTGKGSRIVAAVELGKRISLAENFKEVIHSSKDAGDILKRQMQYLDREVFKVMLLNIKNVVITIDTVSIGGLNFSTVHPREVFKTAIKHSAAGIILAHNHPSGILKPSKEDIDVTKRLVQAGELLGIPVLDHLIICDDIYFSFKEKHLL